MSIVNTLSLESNRQIKINFNGGDLSSDAGLLLIKEFVSKLGEYFAPSAPSIRFIAPPIRATAPCSM